MATLQEELQSAYEDAGYDVGEVSENRDLVRIVLIEDAGAEDVRPIVTDVVGDDALGIDVTSESVEGHAGVNTVVSFRHRG